MVLWRREVLREKWLRCSFALFEFLQFYKYNVPGFAEWRRLIMDFGQELRVVMDKGLFLFASNGRRTPTYESCHGGNTPRRTWMSQ